MSPLAAATPRFTAVPGCSGDARLPAPYALGFALFILVNAVLFVRPGEIVPALLGWEIYQVCIIACLLFSFPTVLEQLLPSSLERQPIAVCVLGLMLAVPLSQLAHFRFGQAIQDGWDFAKIVLYFLLLVGLVRTPERLRTFLRFFIWFAAVVAALAVLQYHGFIKLPNLNPIKDNFRNAATGQETYVLRLQGSGAFQDPNDLCILLVVCVLLCMYWLTDARSGLFRLLMVGPFVLFLYALSRTQSRGGLVALLAGLGVFLWMRFGWLRALLLGLFLVPLLFVVFAGRQTSLSTADGTGQERIQIWSDGMMAFRQSPLFGIGVNEHDKEIGRVAHNSYLHAYTELGIFGGFWFVSAFALALVSLYGVHAGGRQILDPELRRLYPYLFGMIAGYAVGMLSLTLCYIVATYTILGLAIVFRRLAVVAPPLPPPRCDASLAIRLGSFNVAVLIGFNLFIRVFVVR